MSILTRPSINHSILQDKLKLYGAHEDSVGPTLFNLYIHDFAEIVKDHERCIDVTHKEKDRLFGRKKVVRTVAILQSLLMIHVYVTASKSRQDNQEILIEFFSRFKTYLNDNKITVNPSKTILWEFMLHQKAYKIKGNPPELRTQDELGNEKIVKTSNN